MRLYIRAVALAPSSLPCVIQFLEPSFITFTSLSAANTNYIFAAENCIRPFAISRKNFLFCITPQGAKASALYYSLVETCKAMDIDPQRYLTYLFSNAALGPDRETPYILRGKKR
ncbi:MAG TPA: transposase domain-containing protein [Sphaerochaeta sp.]|nr:transposase domain-containing protein [Sphaerochaeta sp.]